MFLFETQSCTVNLLHSNIVTINSEFSSFLHIAELLRQIKTKLFFSSSDLSSVICYISENQGDAINVETVCTCKGTCLSSTSLTTEKRNPAVLIMTT